MFQSAMLYQLIIIGEPVAHLSDDLKAKYDEADWIKIKDCRNYIIHEYFGTELPKIWKAATVDVPVLKNYCRKLFRAEYPDLLEFLP